MFIKLPSELRESLDLTFVLKNLSNVNKFKECGGQNPPTSDPNFLNRKHPPSTALLLVMLFG